MKKNIFLTLLFFANFIVGAQCRPCGPRTFDFNKNGNKEGWNYNNRNNNTVTVTDGLYVYSLDGTEKSPNIRRSHLTAKAHKYFHITLKNESNADAILTNFKDENRKTIFLKPVMMSTDDSGFKTYTFNMADVEEWVSHDTGINFRFVVNSKRTTLINGTITIDKIVANNNPNPKE